MTFENNNLLAERFQIFHACASVENHNRFAWLNQILFNYFSERRQARRAFGGAKQTFRRADFFDGGNQFFVRDGNGGSAGFMKRVEN